MILSSVREKITQYLGCDPKPYLIATYDGMKDTLCEYWNLPILKDEDKPLHIRYNEIALRVSQLVAENSDDPQIGLLLEEIKHLLIGVRVTEKYGASFVTMEDMLKSDPTKGVRKEWWELRSMLAGEGVCLFLDYASVETSATMVHDILIVMPIDDQYEYLRINQTRGNNHPVETEQIINILRKIDEEYRLVIVRASADLVEFILEKQVGAREIPKIRQRLHRLCPDASSLADKIRLGRVELW